MAGSPKNNLKCSTEKCACMLPCGRKKTRCEGQEKARVSKWRETLEAYIAKEDLKHSKQRFQIAELIVSSGVHLDAKGILERVRKKYPEIGAATVYRNIKTLCDAKILHESMRDPSGHMVYELNTGEDHHDHIVCKDCGEIFEFNSEKLEVLQDSLAMEMGFEVVQHRHVIYAKCLFKERASHAEREAKRR